MIEGLFRCRICDRVGGPLVSLDLCLDCARGLLALALEPERLPPISEMAPRPADDRGDAPATEAMNVGQHRLR